MSRLFFLSLILAFGGVLAAARYYPWVEHSRLVSKTAVVANGGRSERFMIRLPADRIGTLGTESAGLISVSPTTLKLPTVFDEHAALLEHFKLRNVDGNVIGVAIRHWTDTADEPAKAWALVIPGRGSLMMSMRASPLNSIETALSNTGYIAGSEWNGELSIDLIGDENPVETVANSAEFDGLNMQLTETWNITGVSASGELRGTIALDTIGRSSE